MMSKKYNVGGKQKRRQQRNRRVFLFGMLSIVVLFILCVWATEKKRAQEERLKENPSFIGAPPFEVELLDINEYSRPGIPLEKINGIPEKDSKVERLIQPELIIRGSCRKK